MAEDLQKLLESLGRKAAKPLGRGVRNLKDLRNDLTRTDTDFDQSGGPHYGLRAGLSRMDTPEERRDYLDKHVGLKGWTQDRFGSYALTPVGMDRLELPHKDKPVLIDEPWKLTRYDIADLTGEAPAIAGGTAAALLTGGAGVIPGLLSAAAGTMVGKAGGEIVEQLQGENLQTFSQVAGDVAVEGLMGAAGEGIFRGVLAPIGRKLMAPNASRMTPERVALTKQAQELGTQPSITQIARPPLMGRMQSMINMIFGDPLAVKNAAAINKEMSRLRTGVSPHGVARQSVGERIAKDISRSRRALSRWSGQVSGKIDEMIGGYPVVPTRQIKETAKDILDSLPRKKPISAGEPGLSYVDDLTG